MTNIHCHTCGGFIADPAIVSHRLPDEKQSSAAVPHTGLCPCAPPIVHGPAAGYLSWLSLLKPARV